MLFRFEIQNSVLLVVQHFTFISIHVTYLNHPQVNSIPGTNNNCCQMRYNGVNEYK